MAALQSVRLLFDPTVSKYNLGANAESLESVKGYSARYPKVFSPTLYSLGNTLDAQGMKKGFVDWDLANGAQGTFFEDTFNRPDGPVANGWTTYKRAAATNQIETNLVHILSPAAIPGSWGNLDYNNDVRPNCAGPGGIVIDGSDQKPLNIYVRVMWASDDVTNYPGFCGAFLYWNSDVLGRTFVGATIGKSRIGPPGFYIVASNGNDSVREGAQIDAILQNKDVYVRVALMSTQIYFDYSLSGNVDDWHPHPSSPIPRVSSTYSYSGAPSHFIIGRGYADQYSTGTFLRNVYLRPW